MKMTLIDPLKEIDRKISDIFQENPPSVNLFEEEDSLCLEVQLPSYNEDEVDVKLTKNKVEITAQHMSETEKSKSDYYLHEAKLDKQYRQIRLPKEIDVDNSHAEMAKGLLTVKMPLKETNEAITLEIESKDGSESHNRDNANLGNL